MNTKIKIIITFMFLNIMYSCTDAIDITQPGTFLAENIYSSMQDLRDSSNFTYNLIDTTDEMKFNAVYTDEISIGVSNGGQAKDEYSLVLAANSTSPNTIWRGTYVNIAHVNRLIEGSASINPTASELTEYNNILGQAYAMRAYLHFVIQSYFTEDMTDDTKKGAIILDHVVGFDTFLSRSDNGVVFDFIHADLDMAESLIQADNGVTYFDLDVINALRARMAAYRGKYDIAAPIATDLLASFPIADRASFAGIWTDVSSSEVIFKLERSKGDGYDSQGSGMGGGGTAGSMFNFTGDTPYLEMGRSLFNLLDPNDIRYDSYLDWVNTVVDTNYMGSIDYISSDILSIGKYPGSETVDLMNDLKVFRSSEMLFIIAEAKAILDNDYNAVATLLKQLKDQRFGASTPLLTLSSQEEAVAAILAERRLEFAFEGHRWLDLRRLGVLGNVEIDRDSRDCEDSGVCSLDKNSYKFTMPIPLRELDVNSNLTQNSNY